MAQDDGRGRPSGGGGGGKDEKEKVGEPTELPVGLGCGEQIAPHNRVESDQPTAAGTAAITECSTDSANTAVAAAGEFGVTTQQVRWRGQSVALAGPVVITLRGSSLRKLRPRRSRCHKAGTDTKALAGDSEYDSSSSDEGSDARSAGARGRGQPKSAQHDVAQGRDRDGKRGPTNGGSSKRGPSAQRDSIRSGPSCGTEAGEEHHADRRNSSSRRRHEEALPLDRTGSSALVPPRGGQGQGQGQGNGNGNGSCRRSLPRPAVFLLEPYAGPPVAACSRAWPAGTRVMAGSVEGCRRRNDRAGHRRSGGPHASRRARGKSKSAGGEAKKRSAERTRLGSSSSPNPGGTTSSGSGSDSATSAGEEKQEGRPRAESKSYQ